MVVLDESDINAVLLPAVLPVGFAEDTSLIPMPDGFDQDNFGYL